MRLVVSTLSLIRLSMCCGTRLDLELVKTKRDFFNPRFIKRPVQFRSLILFISLIRLLNQCVVQCFCFFSLFVMFLIVFLFLFLVSFSSSHSRESVTWDKEYIRIYSADAILLKYL